MTMDAAFIAQLASGVISALAAMGVAVWSAVVASPQLQMLLVLGVLLTLIRGAANGSARKARYK
jgi:hypothetical protein